MNKDNIKIVMLNAPDKFNLIFTKINQNITCLYLLLNFDLFFF